MKYLSRPLTPKERRLAIITIAVVILTTLYSAMNIGVRHLEKLDQEIEHLEDDIYELHIKASRADEVNRAYNAVAEQHSSEWTQAEIHDRLRTELLRLALVNMPPPGSLPSAFSGERLVEIPSWPAGTLDDQGEGIREYHIRVTTKPAPISQVALFLRRIHESPQILRVDRLELVRSSPESSEVVLNMTVTRTIIGETHRPLVTSTPKSRENNLAMNPGFEEWDGSSLSFPKWESSNLALRQIDSGVTEGVSRLEGQARAPSAELYQTLTLVAGNTYEWSADISATGNAQIAIVATTEKKPLCNSVRVEPDGLVRRYRVRFKVPPIEENAADAIVVIPQILIEAEGTQVHVDNVVLTEVAP